MQADRIAAALTTLAPCLAPGATAISDLRLLTGGASMETWAFDATGADGTTPLILRRRPSGAGEGGLSLATEAALIAAAGAAGVPVPRVVHSAAADDPLGEAMIVTRLPGEALGSRIVRSAAFAPARALLPAQCGAALAAIHAVPPVAGLPTRDAAATLAMYRDVWASDPMPRAAIAAAFRWLADTLPPPAAPCLLHGDFRTGNLLVDPERGLTGVLDWELAHVGDPAEDLGWLCVNSWRFGGAGEVGGFGPLDALLAAYNAAAPIPVAAERVRWWQAMGSLKWACMTRTMFAAGGGTLERAVIGRRLSECEADLVALIAA